MIHVLYDDKPFAISMVQPDIAVKSTISCNRFLSLYFSLLLNITRRTINAALPFCHKRDEDTFLVDCSCFPALYEPDPH